MTIDVPKGFIAKTDAARIIGCHPRTLTAWITKALERRDAEFLAHFKLTTNDGTILDGAEVTNEQVAELNTTGMRPGWYVEKSFAESRNELNGSGTRKRTKTPKRGLAESSSPTKLTGATEKQTLQHQLAIERERIKAKDESIESLTEERDFLREELETRRGELDQLSEFFRSIGQAAGSAAQLQEGSRRKVKEETEKGTDAKERPDLSDAGATPVVAISPSFWEKHTPTFRKGLKRVAGSVARA